MTTYPDRFSGKTAVVTGAAQGIGRDVAVRLAREGARVALVDRSDLVEEVRQEAGAEALAVIADLEGYAGAAEAVARALAHFGRIDILVNNVGGTIWTKPFAQYEEAQIEAEISRSLFPTLWSAGDAGAGRRRYREHLVGGDAGREPRALCSGEGRRERHHRLPRLRIHGAPHPRLRCRSRRDGGAAAADPAQRGAADRTGEGLVPADRGSGRLLQPDEALRHDVAAFLFLASDEASFITGITLPVAGGDLG
jgi:dihydroxycyclohexadiene carboxylate dehydrogenase